MKLMNINYDTTNRQLIFAKISGNIVDPINESLPDTQKGIQNLNIYTADGTSYADQWIYPLMIAKLTTARMEISLNQPI